VRAGEDGVGVETRRRMKKGWALVRGRRPVDQIQEFPDSVRARQLIM